MHVSVAVFAHNEARHIERCLASLSAAAEDISIEVVVLANGCSDDTVKVACGWAAHAPKTMRMWVADITRGDKANAWNEFVYCLADDARYYVFCDGDCHFSPRAINHLIEALRVDPHAHAAAAQPVCGRSHYRARSTMQRQHELAGNLYALRGEFVTRLRRAGIRLPVGLVGDDSLVGALVKYDLLPVQGQWDDLRVHPVPQAGFAFDSISPTRAADIAFYWRRRVRYSLRRYQFLALREIFLARGFAAIPACIDDLADSELAAARLSWRGADTLFDWLALRRIRNPNVLCGRA